MQEQLFAAKAYDPLFGDFVWSIGTTLHTRLQFRLQTVSTTTIQTPPNTIFPGAFYHVTITYDGSAMDLYVNGALAASTPSPGPWASTRKHWQRWATWTLARVWSLSKAYWAMCDLGPRPGPIGDHRPGARTGHIDGCGSARANTNPERSGNRLRPGRAHVSPL